MLLKHGIQTIVFARSRVRVEILLTYLQELVKHELGAKSIRGYRGGYLPKQRREIERGLRSGKFAASSARMRWSSASISGSCRRVC